MPMQHSRSDIHQIEHHRHNQQTASYPQPGQRPHRDSPVNAQTSHAHRHRRPAQHKTPVRILMTELREEIANEQRRQGVGPR
jgi:hypothetical protein